MAQERGEGLAQFSQQAGPTGAVRWVNLCVPAEVYAKIEQTAQRLGISTERLYTLALDHLLKVIADAEQAASAPPPDSSKETVNASTNSQGGVAPARRKQPSLPKILQNRRGHT